MRLENRKLDHVVSLVYHVLDELLFELKFGLLKGFLHREQVGLAHTTTQQPTTNTRVYTTCT